MGCTKVQIGANEAKKIEGLPPLRLCYLCVIRVLMSKASTKVSF